MTFRANSKWLFGVLIVGSIALLASSSSPIFSLPDSVLLFGTYEKLQISQPDRTITIEPPGQASANAGYFVYPSISPRGDLIAWGFASQLQKMEAPHVRVKYALGVYSLAQREWKTYGEFEGLGSIGATAFSPDGSRIAFTAKQEGKTELLILDLNDGTTKGLAHPPIWFRTGLSWSPDSSYIALTTTRPSQENPFVTLVDVRTGNVQTLGEGTNPSWSPSGEWIAYFDATATRCLKVHADGTASTAIRSLTHSSHRTFGFGSPVWSPDNRQLLLTEMNDNLKLDVVLVDVDSGRVSTQKKSGLPVFGWEVHHK